MTERKPPPLRLLIALSVLLCLMAGTTMVLILANNTEQDDLRDRLRLAIVQIRAHDGDLQRRAGHRTSYQLKTGMSAASAWTS